jgi:hypothetical protein
MPYTHEHAVRLKSPNLFDSKSYRRTKGGTIYGNKKIPKTISIIWGKLKTANKPSDSPIPQALRFPTINWTISEVKKWLKDNKIKYILFEKASNKKARKMNTAQNWRVLNIRATSKEKIIEVGIVSERVDSYKTVIEPNGLVSDLKSVPVDYNHNRISTGAYLEDLGVQEIEIEVGGKKETIRSRVVEIHVPQTARMWDKTNRSDKPENVPSLYDNIENGRIRWVSVDFYPLEDDVEVVRNKSGKILREVFKKWRLNFLSLLDTKPGQDDSFFLNVRKFNFSSRTIMPKDLKEQIIEFYKSQGTDVTSVESLSISYDDDKEDSGIVSFTIETEDGKEESQLAMNIEDKETVTLLEVVDMGNEDMGENNKKEEEKEDDEASDEEGEVENEEESQEEEEEENEKEEQAEGEELERAVRMYVGDVVKSLDGKYGIVVKEVQESSDKGSSTKVTVQLLDGEEVELDGKEISYDGSKEWTYAKMGELLLKLLGKNETEGSEEEEEVDEENMENEEEREDEEKRSYENLKNKYEDVKKKYDTLRKLNNSPSDDGDSDDKVRSATDNVGAGGSVSKESKEDLENKVTRAQASSRFMIRD